MATFGELVDRTIDASLKRGTVANRSRAANLVNEAWLEISAVMRLTTTSSVETLTAGTADYSIASAFLVTDLLDLREITYTPVGASATTYTLEQTSPAEILDLRLANGASSGVLRYYALRGLDQLMFWPTPNAADSITLYYTPRATPLAAESDTPSALPEEFHDLLSVRAISRLIRQQNHDRAMQYEKTYQNGLADLRRWRNQREGSSGRRAVVGRARRRSYHDNSTFYTGD